MVPPKLYTSSESASADIVSAVSTATSTRIHWKIHLLTSPYVQRGRTERDTNGTHAMHPADRVKYIVTSPKLNTSWLELLPYPRGVELKSQH